MSRDLFLKKTKRSWARDSIPSLTSFSAPVSDEVSFRFTETESALVARLAETKIKAEAGDKNAKAVMARLPLTVANLKAKARKGNPQAKRTLQVLRESGIFNPGQRLSMTGDDYTKAMEAASPLRPKHQRIADLMKLQREGNPFATAALVKEFSMKGISGMGKAPIVDGLPHPNVLTAEQKEDLRTYLRHLPALDKTQVADEDRFVRQIRSTYGEAKERALAGDAAALAKWNQLVEWMNTVQAKSLDNDKNALYQLRTLVKANLFSPRFRIMGWGIKEDSHAKDRRMERFTGEVNALSTKEGYEDIAKMIAFNPEYRSQVELLAKQGNSNAGKVLAAMKTYQATFPKSALAGRSSCGAQIANQKYRAAILKQSLRFSGGRRPSTAHIFKAKTAVDKAMNKAGLSLFLPGTSHGRRTL